ncbi:class I adenylate-forming enzyme family protein [Actinophytocola oryzae]|uniref:Acyl-CoA synthetase (AMP-forming)/AMP-acid ligase II n=1 Tax=Actinophytocola oryzae TaxID=502181 RepID=A0A4R7V950_9PSEU|nr:AMP-binding protein [Actinophytocola oryzae]TDV45442.1 acyl-CoA synthetase (AMP-forming)/AMP-acid ligase II [Actinophytocola oryzae]
MSTFPQPLLDALAEDPRRTVLEHGDRKVSSGELLATVRRMVGALEENGLGRGSGVAMLTGVSPEAFAAYLAAAVAGCRVIGVRPGYPPNQLRHVLTTGVDVLVTDGPTIYGRTITVAELADGPRRDLDPAGGPDDVARLIYTSGSTGTPKGCMQSYEAMSHHWSWAPDMWDDDTRDLAGHGERYLLFGTLASAVVQDYVVLALHSGGTAVIPAVDEPLPYAIQRYGITGTILNVPRLYQFLDILRARDVDTSSLSGMVVAGSPLPPHRFKEAVDRLGPVVYQAYGQSETGNLTLLTPAHIETHGPDILSSVGRPHAHVDVAERDGELYVRTRYAISGYWADDEETADLLADGWVRTRDLGHLDERGFVHLTGRARDVIIVNATPYYAGPIEAVLAAQPDVDQAYVVGAPDELTGEAVHAFVVAAPDRVPFDDALRGAVLDALGQACVPKTITLLSEVPVANSGKPDKHALRDSLR